MNDQNWLASHSLTARLMSFAKTVRQYEDGSKTVTRRGGPEPTWQILRPGDLVRGVEWSPRVGRRYVCEKCGSLGGAKFHPGSVALCGGECPDSGQVRYRLPRRLGLAVILDVREESLGDITAEEVAREGFPDLSPSGFILLYTGFKVTCAYSSKPGPIQRALNWRVNRIEFARIIDQDGERVVRMPRSDGPLRVTWSFRGMVGRIGALDAVSMARRGVWTTEAT